MGSYAPLQDRFASAVAANRLRVDPLWRRSVRAYNLHARPDDNCGRRLSAVQDELARLGEDGLLRCPPASLHVSLGSFLFVRENYAEPKDALWARHRQRWLQGLARILARVRPFSVSYRRVIVTDSAVIALAEYPKQVTAIREGLTSLRSTCGLDGRQPSIVHTTLFRYGAALRNPTALLEAARHTRVAAWFQVRDVVVTRELLYPSLSMQDLARLPLPCEEHVTPVRL